MVATSSGFGVVSATAPFSGPPAHADSAHDVFGADLVDDGLDRIGRTPPGVAEDRLSR